MFYPTQQQLARRRAAIVCSVLVAIAAAFAIGVTVQRIEGKLATEDGCLVSPDAIGCLIVLDGARL
jgi:hypothetical protein